MGMIMRIVVVVLVMMVEIHLQSFILQQSQQFLVEQLGFGTQELGHLMKESGRSQWVTKHLAYSVG